MSNSNERRKARWIALVAMSIGFSVFFVGGGTSDFFPSLPYTSLVTHVGGLVIFASGFALAYFNRLRGNERKGGR